MGSCLRGMSYSFLRWEWKGNRAFESRRGIRVCDGTSRLNRRRASGGGHSKGVGRETGSRDDRSTLTRITHDAQGAGRRKLQCSLRLAPKPPLADKCWQGDTRCLKSQWRQGSSSSPRGLQSYPHLQQLFTKPDYAPEDHSRLRRPLRPLSAGGNEGSSTLPGCVLSS